MLPWTTERRWRCTWRRDRAPWSKTTPSRAKKMVNSNGTHRGGGASAAERDLGRVSRAASPLHLRNRVSWSRQRGPLHLEKLEQGLSAQRIYQDLLGDGFDHEYHVAVHDEPS